MADGSIVIRFEPRRGRKLLRNLEANRHLLRHASALSTLTGEEADRIAIEVISGFHIAFDAQSRQIRNRTCFDHLWELHLHNRRIHRLVPSPRPVTLEIRTAGGVEWLDLGHTVGFTGVYPLTEDGFSRLVTTDIGVASLMPEGIVPASEYLRPQSTIYIGGVVDVRRLNHPDWVNGNPGRAVFAALFHLASFLPPVRWYPGVPEDRLVTEDGSRLPRLCAFADPGSESASFLWRAGFRKIGMKWNGEVKYALDMADWNSRRLSPKRRTQFLRTIRGLQFVANKDRTGVSDGENDSHET